MKTAEVAIEHVLTGLLTLCAFVLPFLDSTARPSGGSLTNSAIVGVLGLAYLVGVVFDKLADTMLSPLEQWIRLSLAGPPESEAHDPFPQDALEYALRAKGGTRVEWMDSLRSRIRTCRGLAVLGAPAALGVAAFLDPSAVWLPPIVAFATLLLVIAAAMGEKRFKLRRTDVPPDPKAPDGAVLRRAVVPYGLLGSTAGLASITYLLRAPLAGFVATAGLALSALALWAWARITETHMKFVLKATDLLEKGAARTPASQ